MAFTPIRGKYYFLIAKHSGMPLGVHDNSGGAGAAIEQQAFNPSTVQPQQHFLFDAAEDQHVYIKPGHRDLYLEPKDSRDGRGREDGTAIVQAVWNANHAGQRFQLIPAGDGYYRIRSRYAGSFWDVAGNNSAVGAPVILYGCVPSGANQLFRPVLVVGQGLGPDPTSFKEANDHLRTALISMAGAVPKVGKGLGFILKGLWPVKSEKQMFWEQMKEYVDQRVKALLHEHDMEALRTTLEGLLDHLKLLEAKPDTVSNPKGPEVTTIVGTIIEKHKAYLGDEHTFTTDESINPQQILPYFVGMGTLLLSLIRQQAVTYRELYNPMADDLEAKKGADTKQREAAEAAAFTLFYEKQLRYMLLRYTRAAASARARSLAWRLNHIKPVTKKTESSSGAQTTTSAVRDEYDDWSMSWSYTDRIYSKNSGDADHRERAEYAYTQRRQQVEVQFGAELDALLNPVRLWKYYDQAVARLPQPVRSTISTGPFGGYTNGTPFDAPAGHGRLSMIVVYTHEHIAPLAGIEFFYNGFSAGLMGKITSKVSVLELAADEYVTSVHGTQYNVLESVVFQTNKGREVRGGGGGSAWNGDVPDDLSARLVKVSGKARADMIDSLTLHWEYEYPAAPLPALADLPSLNTLQQHGTELHSLRHSLPPLPAPAEA